MAVRMGHVAWGTAVLLSTLLGCAGDPGAEREDFALGEVRIESPDPTTERHQSALSADDLPELPFAPLSICKEFGSTYADSPWTSAWSGSARCIRQTITVPEIGFGTDHETSASFPEFTGLMLTPVGEKSVADKCRDAGIKVTVRWTSEGGSNTWNYVVPAKPVFGPVARPSPSPGPVFTLSRVVSCTAKHSSGLGGHGPGKFVISTSPFTGVSPTPFPAFRPMSSSVEPLF